MTGILLGFVLGACMMHATHILIAKINKSRIDKIMRGLFPNSYEG